MEVEKERERDGSFIRSLLARMVAFEHRKTDSDQDLVF